jgi:transposase
VAGTSFRPLRASYTTSTYVTYHSRKSRRELRVRKVKVRVARPGDPHGSGLGRKRWVVERTIAWLHQYRRLRVRYERRADIHEAFLMIGCCLICFKQLQAGKSL